MSTNNEIDAASTYLEDMGRQKEFVDYMDKEVVTQLFETSSEIQRLKVIVARALLAASEGGTVADVARMSTLLSLVNALDHLGSSKEELSARFKIGQRSEPLMLARRSPLKEHRLAMLGRYARLLVEHDELVDADLRNQSKPRKRC